jgi:diguanylate cyclase (GGDEF)-like protein
MKIEVILLLGAIALTCGSAGLLMVRLTNPLLRGIGWLGASFAAGGTSASLLLWSHHSAGWLSLGFENLALLLSFVLLHMAVLGLTEDTSAFPALGTALLSLQAAIALSFVFEGGSTRLRVFVAGALVSVQAAQTAIVLLRVTKRGILISARFTAAILLSFASLYLSWSVIQALDKDWVIVGEAEMVTFVLYLTIALGVAFGFFWMTTTMLSVGLEDLASIDPLTQIYNRRFFLKWCEKEVVRSQRSALPFSLLLIDLDHFKRINDSFGHHSGDSVLCAVVENIQDSIREIDVLGRWGGEEFVVLLPGASSEAAFLVAQRVRENIEGLLLPEQEIQPVGSNLMIVTVSIGIATYRGFEDLVHTMLQRADTALYEAKASGRNCVLTAA